MECHLIVMHVNLVAVIRERGVNCRLRNLLCLLNCPGFTSIKTIHHIQACMSPHGLILPAGTIPQFISPSSWFWGLVKFSGLM